MAHDLPLEEIQEQSTLQVIKIKKLIKQPPEEQQLV
jgi:hypothetical protein